jgi:hypothetical protein
MFSVVFLSLSIMIFTDVFKQNEEARADQSERSEQRMGEIRWVRHKV